MIGVSELTTVEARPLALSGDDGAAITFAAGEILFKAGERKTQAYRVESGVVCLYDPRWNGDKAVIEFAFPGDFLGVGFLDTHALSARAVLETRVSPVAVSEVDELIDGDPRAEAKRADAIEREFEARREALVGSGTRKPVERVAALLVNLSCSNVYEGRDATLITDSMQCGAIADMLGVSISDLREMLLDLERRGLVEPAPGGLRLNNIDALENLADGPTRGSDEVQISDRRVRPPKLPAHCSQAA